MLFHALKGCLVSKRGGFDLLEAMREGRNEDLGEVPAMGKRAEQGKASDKRQAVSSPVLSSRGCKQSNSSFGVTNLSQNCALLFTQGLIPLVPLGLTWKPLKLPSGICVPFSQTWQEVVTHRENLVSGG